MTSVKISQLPSGSTLTGTELIPAVQDGVTVKATAAQVRAGLADTALANVTTGDFLAKAGAAGLTAGAPLADATPAPLGTAAAGTATAAARADHVHRLPSLADLGAAAAGHGHAVSDTTGLQAALDSKLAVGRHTLWVPATAFTPRTTNGASFSTTETTTARIVRRTLDFDPTTAEYAQFTIAMPKSWDRGAMMFQALWTAATGSGGVAWTLQGVALSDGDAGDAAFGTPVTATDTLTTAGAMHITATSGAMTIAGSPAAEDLVVFQAGRATTDAADTLAQDALLLGIRLFYTINAATDA